MIVAAHMHVWNRLHGRIGGEVALRAVRDGRVRVGDDELLGMPAHMADCNALAELAVAEFDAAGVDVGVVVQEYMDGEQNDYLLEVRDRFPDRFFLHGLPDFFDPDHTAEEAFALFDRGFSGLKLSAGHLAGKVQIDDERFLPIYERMEHESLVLAADLSEGEEQAAELERILAHCPALRVAVGHFGLPTRGGWPGQLSLARHDHVYLEGGGLVWLYRGEGYPFPGAVEAIRHAIDEVGAHKLMWGSDWPRTMCDFTYRQSLDFARCSGALSDEEKTAFLGANAAGLYGLLSPAEKRAPVPHITEG
ncbi:MAG: amidohydrolase [Planctomycetes bacterium]|nr:amidohydrolase [Planctomycetota bacterium]